MALITQTDLAADVGVPQTVLSRAERDSYDLGDDRLAIVASHLEFPMQFFTSPPLVEFGQRPVHFRARTSMPMKLADQATRTGELVAEALHRLEQQFEGPRLKLPAAELHPETAAHAMRNVLGLSPRDAAIGLPVLLEHVGVAVVGLPLVADRRDAYSLWLEDRPLIALLETDAGDRQLWSTAHELGHILLHRGVPVSKQVESEADEFARHFLTPLETIADEMPIRPTLSDFALLKRRWGVSIASLIRTARQLDRISADQYTSLFKQMSARGERLRERTFIEPVKPRGFRALAELAYGVSPTHQLARANHWPESFAARVLRQHARADELPVNRRGSPADSGVILRLASYRRGARSRAVE